MTTEREAAQQRLDAIRALLNALGGAFCCEPGAEVGAVMFLAMQYAGACKTLNQAEKEQAEEEAEALSEYRSRT